MSFSNFPSVTVHDNALLKAQLSRAPISDILYLRRKLGHKIAVFRLSAPFTCESTLFLVHVLYYIAEKTDFN